MRSPIQAVIWEVWARKRTAVWLALATTSFGYLLSAILPESVTTQQLNGQGSGFLNELLNMHLAAAVIILILAICSYTEFNAQTGTSGFPRRLFALPISTLQLISVPMALAIVIVEVAYALWRKFVFKPDEQTIQVALLLGTYIVLHQTVLWTLHGLKSLRLLVLGMIGIIFIMSPIFAYLNGVSAASFDASLVGMAVTGFLTSWFYVSRQRSGGGSSLDWLRSVSDEKSAATAYRERVFSSPQSAQFWFEWRRCGSVFPTIVGALLLAVIVPFSWYMRADGLYSSWIVLATLAMPIVLALPIGKAFSKPDFWSKDLDVPAVVAVRPITSLDIVAIKMKTAAVSAAIVWSLVLVFVTTWLSLWANHDAIAMIRSVLSRIHGRSEFSPYAIVVLAIAAMMVVTWRFLIGGMWLGLYGKRTLFAVSAIPYVVVPLFILPAILIAMLTNAAFLAWMHTHIDVLLYGSVWIAATAVCMKFVLAASLSRGIRSGFVRPYLMAWFGGTVLLVTLAVLLSNALSSFYGAPALVRILLILIALLVFPLARPAAAPAALERNRHRA